MVADVVYSRIFDALSSKKGKERKKNIYYIDGNVCALYLAQVIRYNVIKTCDRIKISTNINIFRDHGNTNSVLLADDVNNTRIRRYYSLFQSNTFYVLNQIVFSFFSFFRNTLF